MTSIILADRQYTLNSFYKISEKNNFIDLSDAVIEIINRLSEKVGAPTYQRTPSFNHNRRGGKDRRNRPPKKQAVITAEDWEAIRNFKATKLEKAENAVDKEIENITSLLNKITASNYDSISETIKTSLVKIIDDNVDNEGLTKIGCAIFEIGSINKYWSKLYAKLYKDIIELFPIMKEICDKNFESFLSVFDNIRYIDADEDYDMFCKVNKENGKRRSLSSFFVQLMNNNVINTSQIMNIINNLKERFISLMDIEGNKDVILEIGENLIILIEQGQDILSENDNEWEPVTNFVEHIASLKQKNHASLSSQIVFKFLDLSDDL
jgi:hypothetical protein